MNDTIKKIDNIVTKILIYIIIILIGFGAGCYCGNVTGVKAGIDEGKLLGKAELLSEQKIAEEKSLE